MVDRNDSLMREVDEELRREQVAKLWEQYGVYAIAAAALIVIGVGGWKYMEHSRLIAAQALGARFEAALTLAEEGKPDEARTAFEAIGKEPPSGYQTLAQLRLAGDLAKGGRNDEAVAAYDALAKRGGINSLFAEFASLQSAMLRSGTADWTEMQNRLNGLVQETSAWRHAARELHGIEALRAGKLDEARKSFEQLLTDRKTPDGVSKRTQNLMAIVAAAQLALAKPAGEKTAADAASGEKAAGEKGAERPKSK